ncbi:integrase [Sedimenticola selenatireducens]|uniref:Integrase n=1 Tax=Sedimenticola selenatireducens TaxID=191960 RepID=A0A558E1S9_9GAMM|nr:integrase [Sedimenticola selenatireducens]TVO75098.1 integrase [Sedimenticola selenatireducens]TVT67048.1 MAG: integrase [Sedimenticola selenatireducens]
MSPKSKLPINRPLPKRWRIKNGAYYYRVPPADLDLWDGKQEFRLGKSEAEAYKTWSKRLNAVDSDLSTMTKLMDRYLLEVIPSKAPKTQTSNRTSIGRLRPIFGPMQPDGIKPRHYNAYKHEALKKYGKTSVNHDLEVLSHLITMAVEWGAIDRNPLLGQVKKHSTPPRLRLVEDWEITEALNLKPPTDKRSARNVRIAQLYVQLKLMTGLRRGDILRLKLLQIKDDGIHVQPNKTAKTTGKRLIIDWDEAGELRALIDDILRIPPRRIGDAPLFTTNQGKPYIKADGSANAFDSLWQRFMDRVMDQTKITDRFQERDLRAKAGSDKDTLQEASEFLAHSDTRITDRVYRRKPTHIKPLKRPGSE